MGIARSGIGWMIGRFGALMISWLASLYFTRALTDPQATLGTFYAFETAVSFIVLLANGGLNSAIVKRVSEGEEAPEFATAGLLMSGALVVSLSIIIVLATPLLTDFFGYGGLSVVLLVGTLLAYQVRDTLNALLTSNFQLGRTGLVDFANAVGQVSIQVFLISAGFGALALMAGYMVGTVVAAGVAIVLVARRLELTWPSKRHFQSLVDFARFSFLNGFAQKFYDNVDIIIITALLGKSATGVYGIGFRFSLLLTVFYTAINRTSDPEISKHHGQGNYDRIKEVLSDAIVLGLLIGLPAFTGFFVLARPIITTFYTQEFAAATLVAVAAVATRIPEGLRSSFSSVLAGVDRPDIVFRGGVILMFVNLTLDLLLVPQVGIIGAVFASFIGMVSQLLYMGNYLSEIINFGLDDIPLKDISLEATAATLMAAIIFAIQSIFEPTSIVRIFILVLLGVLVYLTILLLIAPDIRSRITGITSDLVKIS